MKSYKIHKRIKPHSKLSITALPDNQGNYCNSIESNLNNILNCYSPDSGHLILPEQNNFDSFNLPTIDFSVNYANLKAIIFALKPNKAPGYDGFSPIIFQKSLFSLHLYY